MAQLKYVIVVVQYDIKCNLTRV